MQELPLFSVPTENLLPFTVCPLQPTRILWLAKTTTVQADEFLRRYAVGIRGNANFTAMQMDECQSTSVFAERYGGAGGGVNAGGARCANFAGAQVKGVGTNPLVGINGTKWHSHGAQNLVEAVCEVIYGDVLVKIMPIGTVANQGIIVTTQNAAYYTADIDAEEFTQCWGALLVRNKCVRPAHFLRARGFKASKIQRQIMAPDVVRIRRLYRELAQQFGDHNAFIAALGVFIRAAANQFAFAQVARIAHLATSPSNIAMNGKWLDLASVSFLDGGKNYAVDLIQRPFLQEQSLIPETVVEMLATYAKFNQVTLNPLPLLNYFTEAMTTYFHDHCAYLLGLPKEYWPSKGELPECDALTQAIHQLIHFDTNVVVDLPATLNPQDPVIGFVQTLFVSLADTARAAAILAGILDHRFDIAEILRCFASTLAAVKSKLTAAGENTTNFYKTAALNSLKKAYCSAFFYRGRIKMQLDDLLFSAEPEAFIPVINESADVASWVFAEPVNSRVVLFATSQASLHYSATTGTYSLDGNWPAPIATFDNFDTLLLSLRNIPITLLSIQNFEFLLYLAAIAPVMAALEAL